MGALSRRRIEAAALVGWLSLLGGCTDWDAAVDAFCANNNPRCKANAGVWDASMGGVGVGALNSMEVDASGSIVLGGSYAGAFDFGGGAAPTPGQKELFVARLDPKGIPLWALAAGGSGNEQVAEAVPEAEGNTFAVGDFGSASVDMGNGIAMHRAGSTDGFVVKLSPSGSTSWATVIGAGGAAVLLRGVAAAPGSGELAVSGTFSGSVPFGSGVETSTHETAVLFRVSPDGVANGVIARASCASGRSGGQAVQRDGSGNIYWVGLFEGQCAVAGQSLPLSSAGGPGFFVAKLDSGGARQWLVRFEQAEVAGNMKLRFDNKGNLLVAGALRGRIPLPGGFELRNPSAGTADGFILKLDGRDGATAWGAGGGGPGNDEVASVSVGADNDIWVTGGFEGTSASFGSTTLVGKGGADAFIAHYSETGELLKAVSYGAADFQSGKGIYSMGADVLFAGEFAGSLEILRGETLETPGVGLFVSRIRL
jgi:hypothetical protein